MRRLTFALVLLTACGSSREPGPHESERGLVTFWEVTSLDSTVGDCTDDPDFQGATSPPPLEENSFLMYRVSEDGSTAQSMSCTETRAESCAEGDLVFEVSGSTLTLERAPEQVTTVGDCTINSVQLWTIEDQGGEGTLSVDLSFEYTGDTADCEAAEDILSNGSSNGFGLVDCVVTLDADLAFNNVD